MVEPARSDTMELEFQQVQIPYLRSVLYETVLHEESGETVVPDTMPDMERIVFAPLSP